MSSDSPSCTARVLPAVAAALFVPLLPGTLRAHEEYSRREGLSCAACHVGSTGGPLTGLGREYLWNGSAIPTQSEDRRDLLGRWSGEWSSYGRTYRERVLGDSVRGIESVHDLRLHGDQLGGVDGLRFDGEGLGRAVSSWNGHDGFEDDEARLLLATLQYEHDDSGRFRLGRQWISSGATARRLDGLSYARPIGDAVRMDAFGGVPSENAESGSAGDLLLGGRVGIDPGERFDLGLSGFYAKDDGDPSDAKFGLDLSVHPTSNLDVFGFLYYDWIGEEFYDGRLDVVYRPSVRWRISADYSHTVPGLFLPKNSIFSVFSTDSYDETSLTLRYRFDERRSAYVFERITWYEEGSSVLETGVGTDLRYGPGGEDVVGLELSHHDERRHRNASTDSDGDALFARVYHRLYWTARTYTVADVLVQAYSGSPFERDSRLGRLLVGHQVRTDLELQVGVEALRNPEFPSRVDGLARVTYRF